MKWNQYEIWIADLNPRMGTESGKKRPVLIVQTNLLNKVHPSTLICPITSNVRKEVSILRVNLEVGQAGLNQQSAIMIDQIRAIDNKRLLKKIGDLPKNILPRVEENLKIMLDLI